MKLDFEKWLDEQPEILEYKRQVFDDAVNCYKHGIYRPALMLSYIGFLFIVRDRFLQAEKPDLYEQVAWDALKHKVVMDDKWESELLNILSQQEKRDSANQKIVRTAPFNINDDIRSQIKYWKDRRNDCAHYKSNEITEAHVIAFWSFIKSKLQYITVEGGLQSLLNKIKKFYDISITPANSEIQSLINDVEKLISKDTYQEILTSVFSSISKHSYLVNYDFLTPYYLSPKIRSFLLQLIKSDKNLLKHFIEEKPSSIKELLVENGEIRKFWYEKIYFYSNKLSIYAEMLLADMIPEEQIFEANEKILSFIYNNPSFIKIDGEIQRMKLIEKGFYRTFVENFMSEDFFKMKYKDLNFKTDFYINMIYVFGYNAHLVKAICLNLVSNKHHPYVLMTRLKEMLQENEKYRDDFKNIVIDTGITIPDDYSTIFR